ncbi:MAG: rod shape-determining protein MreD [Lachnospiraceae bacterium]
MFTLIKKWIVGILTVLLLFALQTSAFRYLPFGRSVPNFILIITCMYGLMRGEYAGIITGFTCGLMLDIFCMDILGFYALLYTYVGFFCGLANKYYKKEDYKLPAAALILSDITFMLLKFFFTKVLLGYFDFQFYFRDSILPEFAFTILSGIIIYPMLLFTETHFIDYTSDKSDSGSEGGAGVL